MPGSRRFYASGPRLFFHRSGHSLCGAESTSAGLRHAPGGVPHCAADRARLEAVFLTPGMANRVGFFSNYGGAEGTAVLGLPTSSPAGNPANAEVVYQPFQNKVLP